MSVSVRPISRVAVAAALLPSLALAQPAGNFRMDSLAPGVHALIRLDPLAYVNNANSTIVVGDSGVLVVDAQFSRAATLETIAAIRARTRLPVRYVVVTHWHDDHFGGVQVYRDTFPGVRIVAQVNTRADLVTQGRPNREGSWSVGPGFTARFERLLAQGLGVDSTPVTTGERRAMESVIAVGRRYVADKDGFRETLPDLTFSDRLTIHLGRRRVDVHHFGPANTRGDAIVHVPDAGVVATGDLLVRPVPFAFGAFIASWRDALDSVRALRPTAIVPGHGPAMRDLQYLQMVRNGLDLMDQRVRAANARGSDRRAARAAASLDDLRDYFTGDDPWLRTLYTRFFVDPAFAAVYDAVAPRPAAPDSARAAIQRSLDSLRVANRWPGVSLAYALPDGRTVALVSGLSDTTRRVALRTSDRLLQGSVGKTYVAAVALQLVHEGKLRLDEKVGTYLGGERWFARLPNGPDVTVRQLMNHTSGIVRYEFQPKFAADLRADPFREWTVEERLSYILGTPAPFAAGQGWEYSDTNYILLGLIIERLTGQPYYAEVRRRILVPLQLANTIPSDRRDMPGVANGYAGPKNDLGGYDASLVDGRFAVNPGLEWTGGGMASTTEDLARWGKLLYEGRAFDPALLPLMLDGVPARLGRDTKYGLGVIIRPTPLGVTYGHSGFFPGYATELLYVPESKLALALQVNVTDPYPRGMVPFLVSVARTLLAR